MARCAEQEVGGPICLVGVDAGRLRLRADEVAEHLGLVPTAVGVVSQTSQFRVHEFGQPTAIQVQADSLGFHPVPVEQRLPRTGMDEGLGESDVGLGRIHPLFDNYPLELAPGRQ
jgi:hypothetical protein